MTNKHSVAVQEEVSADWPMMWCTGRDRLTVLGSLSTLEAGVVCSSTRPKPVGGKIDSRIAELSEEPQPTRLAIF